jgi:hypothetical protein
MASRRTVIRNDRVATSTGPTSQAVRPGDLVFTADITVLHPATGALLDGAIRAATRPVPGHVQPIPARAGHPGAARGPLSARSRRGRRGRRRIVRPSHRNGLLA